MKKLHRICAQALLAGPLLLQTSLSGASEFEFARCTVSKGAIQIDAECATFTRLENPEDVGGKTIELAVTRFPAHTANPESDAFTVIQGGPGMSSIDLYLQMRGVFAGIRAKRDILVVDQRGTGRSNMLGCALDAELQTEQFSAEQTREFAEQCLAELSADPRFYTTSVAVDDLDAVRDAAGYPQLSIYGVSYGTRVAQHFARKYPAQTRALILDGVADIDLNLAGSEIAKRSQQAFDNLVARCTATPACVERFGNLQDTFTALRTQLLQQPAEVTLLHPTRGVMIQEALTEQRLLGLVRLMPYATESLALLPMMLAQAQQGNYTPLIAAALLTEDQFAADYAYAMNNAVICSEDFPFLSETDLEGDEETYFGREMALSLRALCEVWPRGVVDADFREPLLSQVPTLLLSGEFDPITPAQNAERAKQNFVNSVHITVPGHGHGVIGRGCIPQLATRFIENAQTTELQIDCAQREAALPLFLSPTGPNP